MAERMLGSSCPHGMPNPRTCVDCMEEGIFEKRKWQQDNFSFSAGHPGVCAACDQEYDTGDMITRWDQMEGGTVMDSKYTHILCRMN